MILKSFVEWTSGLPVAYAGPDSSQLKMPHMADQLIEASVRGESSSKLFYLRAATESEPTDFVIDSIPIHFVGGKWMVEVSDVS